MILMLINGCAGGVRPTESKFRPSIKPIPTFSDANQTDCNLNDKKTACTEVSTEELKQVYRYMAEQRKQLQASCIALGGKLTGDGCD